MEKKHTTTQNWYVYIIENRLAQLYTGVTNNPRRRMRQHVGEIKGGAKALKGKAPLAFRWVGQVSDKATAMRTEYRIKQMNRAAKLAVINGTSQHLDGVTPCLFHFIGDEVRTQQSS
ncbi:GIY-YIG nuclease family protein [Aestuariibacter sp. A3R04]|uniref:GIY-YIG nuclease family protein n=1 Tax=Aestuariibacter sp. A3R04 TaxID=2841571 RepID=UPI001C087706|nr:GIY-YIG nuclease family protein [Aestuariibacter sp. A3R04]MBU3021736.1 GIY-YIG nuclease family protein [Aestuariibacter sp. A3R04]